MAVSSFLAGKLSSVIAKLSEPVLSTNTIRYDVAPVMRGIITKTEDPLKKILAYVLWTKCLNICDRFDGEPMNEEVSQALAIYFKSVIKEAVRLLTDDAPDTVKVITLINMIITNAPERE